MLIALVGLPGSGKSTIGRRLARRFELAFVDADREIEREAGCSIPALFEREGEAGFREREERMIAALLEGERAVVATGGGAVMRPSTRRVLRERSTVVYLRCPPEQLASRVRDDGRRPLFSGVDVQAKMNALFEERDPLYAETSHIVVEGDRQQFARVLTALEPLLRESRGGAS